MLGFFIDKDCHESAGFKQEHALRAMRAKENQMKAKQLYKQMHRVKRAFPTWWKYANLNEVQKRVKNGKAS